MSRFLVVFSMILLALSMTDGKREAKAAEQFPVKPINFIVAVEPGSGGDVYSRPLCQRVSAILGQPVIIINKPGAGSSIGYREIYNAKPDGYTIGIGMGTIVTNKLQGLMPYDHNDFTMMGVFYEYQQIIVASKKTQRPFNSIEEVIAFAKSRPGEISIATGAVGQMIWYSTMAFVQATGLKFNVIPQPGAVGFAMAQVAGGHTDLAVVSIGGAKPQIDAGNVRMLAILGSERPPAPYNNIPALKELGYDTNVGTTGSIIGPPNMPRDVTDVLVKALKRAITDPEYQKFLSNLYANPKYLPPGEAIELLNNQRNSFRGVAEKAGVLKGK